MSDTAPTSGGAPTTAATTPSNTSTAAPSTPAPVSGSAPTPKSAVGKIPVPAEVAGVTGSAPEGQAAETPAEKKRRLAKIKVDGVESEVDLDSLSDDDLVRELQMSRAARKRMQEAAELKKQWESARDFIKKDPFAALKHEVFGNIDLEKLAEERLAQKYQEMNLPEDQKKVLEAQRRAEAAEKQVAEWKAQQEAAARVQHETRVMNETKAHFEEVLKIEGVPHTRETVVMMAEIAKLNLEQGIELTPQQMAHEVKQRLVGIQKQTISGLKGEALVKFLGEDVVKEILAHSVKEIQAKRKPSFAPPLQEQKVSEPDDKPPRKMQDYKSVRNFFRK